MKRRGNRRYYQHHEVLMIRRIRDLLYDQGFTISGARNRLQELVHTDRADVSANPEVDGTGAVVGTELVEPPSMLVDSARDLSIDAKGFALDSNAMRKELFEIRALLSPG
jgi:DNA-binding transcriptional MerR regulator